MTGMGMALMGTGVAKGENRAIEAAQRAISSPLLEETSIEGARGVLLNVSGGSRPDPPRGGRGLPHHPGVGRSRTPTSSRAWCIDEEMEDEMKVTVIATGFHYEPQEKPLPVERRFEPRVIESRQESRGRAAAGGAFRSADGGALERAPRLLRPPTGRGAACRGAARIGAGRRHRRRRRSPSRSRNARRCHSSARCWRTTPARIRGGYGPNWSGVDDFDIPTVLRKQMD